MRGIVPLLAIGGAMFLFRDKTGPPATRPAGIPETARPATSKEIKALRDGKLWPADAKRVWVVDEKWFRSGPRATEGPVRHYGGGHYAIGSITLLTIMGIETIGGWL